MHTFAVKLACQRGYITFILQYMMISFQKRALGVQPAFHFFEEEQYNQRFPREIHPTLDKDDISAFTISAFLSFVDHRKISICQGTWRQLAEVKRNLSIKFYVKVSLLQFFLLSKRLLLQKTACVFYGTKPALLIFSYQAKPYFMVVWLLAYVFNLGFDRGDNCLDLAFERGG